MKLRPSQRRRWPPAPPTPPPSPDVTYKRTDHESVICQQQRYVEIGYMSTLPTCTYHRNRRRGSTARKNDTWTCRLPAASARHRSQGRARRTPATSGASATLALNLTHDQKKEGQAQYRRQMLLQDPSWSRTVGSRFRTVKKQKQKNSTHIIHHG